MCYFITIPDVRFSMSVFSILTLINVRRTVHYRWVRQSGIDYQKQNDRRD